MCFSCAHVHMYNSPRQEGSKTLARTDMFVRKCSTKQKIGVYILAQNSSNSVSEAYTVAVVKLNKRQLLVYHSVAAGYFPHLSQQCVWPQRSACMKTKAIVASRIITFRAQRGLKPDPLNCSSYSLRAGVLTTDAVYCQHVYR